MRVPSILQGECVVAAADKGCKDKQMHDGSHGSPHLHGVRREVLRNEGEAEMTDTATDVEGHGSTSLRNLVLLLCGNEVRELHGPSHPSAEAWIMMVERTLRYG